MINPNQQPSLENMTPMQKRDYILSVAPAYAAAALVGQINRNKPVNSEAPDFWFNSGANIGPAAITGAQAEQQVGTIDSAVFAEEVPVVSVPKKAKSKEVNAVVDSRTGEATLNFAELSSNATDHAMTTEEINRQFQDGNL